MLGKIWNYAKHHKRNLIILVIVVAAVLFFIFKPSATTNVREHQVAKTEVIKNINASGETEALSSNVVKSPIAAKVKKVNYLSGAQVKKDDVILEFDELSLNASYASAWQTYLAAKASAGTYEQQLQAAKAAEADKKFSRDTAQREYNSDNSFDNKQAYKTAESAYQSALASLQSLQDKETSTKQAAAAAYNSFLVANDNYKNTKLKAPEDGLVALEEVKVGDTVLAGQKLYSITNSKTLQFVAEVDEADVQSIVLNQEVSIELEGYSEKTFPGLVASIDAKTVLTNSGSNIVKTYISVDFGEIKPIIGLTGTAKIQIGKESQKLAVPFDSVLFEGDDNNYVYVIKNNKVFKTKVEVGFEGDEYYVIKSGLNEGDNVVTGVDITTLKDGQQVSIIKN